MSAPGGDTASTLGDLQARIDVLEAALRVLRREIVDREEPRAARSDFHALRFRVGALKYAVPIDEVREVVRYVHVTPIADVAEIVSGAIDVAGELVPVVDARKRFAQPVTFRARGTAIILLSFRESTVGLVVDDIEDVVFVPGNAVASPAGILSGAVGVRSVATLSGDVIQILDVREVLTHHQWESMVEAIDKSREGADGGDTGSHGAGSAHG